MEKKYQIIYADPPWRYDFSESKSRQIENHYPTMALNDIKALKIPAEDNCLLYIWVTPPKVEEAIEVMVAWGFKYRTCLVWDKEKIGMGRWFRQQHELLFVGVKGKFATPEPSKRISSVLRDKRTIHSKKPDYIRDCIRVWYPNASKVELFARNDGRQDIFGKSTWDGWDLWGNET